MILLAAALSCLVFIPSCGSRSRNGPPRGGLEGSGRMAVSGVVVRPQPLESVVRSSGTVLASESVDLVAEAAGRVDKLLFTEGSRVKKDDLLLKINDDDLQAGLKKNELQIQLAADQESRQKQLFDKSLISKEQYDNALIQLNSLKADRDNLLASIRRREVRAPFDGIIGLRYVSEGGYVTSSSRIASIQKINFVKVDFSIPEKYAGKVSVGDRVLLSNEETNLKATGKVYAIEPKIDPAMGTLKLRAVCENTSGRIFPGAYVQVELRLERIQDALTVPTQAVIPVLKGQTVLVQKNGAVVSVPVKTGLRTSTTVQITSGLAPGDTVITTGIMQLRPGMLVDVTVK